MKITMSILTASLVALCIVADAQETPLTLDHPVSVMLGNTAEDKEEGALIHLEGDGIQWIKTTDGRIRSGAWWLDADGLFCMMNGGVYEGCYKVAPHKSGLNFTDGDNDVSFILTLHEGRTDAFLSPLQRKFYQKMTAAVGVLTSERGKEGGYLQRNGQFNVIQPEGSVHIGRLWFNDKGQFCDDVSGTAVCVDILSVDEQGAKFKQDDDIIEVTFDYSR